MPADDKNLFDPPAPGGWEGTPGDSAGSTCALAIRRRNVYASDRHIGGGATPYPSVSWSGCSRPTDSGWFERRGRFVTTARPSGRILSGSTTMARARSRPGPCTRS